MEISYSSINDESSKSSDSSDGTQALCEYIKLEKITHDDIVKLKDLYYKENLYTDVIDYGDVGTYFSMNDGDYLKPLI